MSKAVAHLLAAMTISDMLHAAGLRHVLSALSIRLVTPHARSLRKRVQNSARESNTRPWGEGQARELEDDMLHEGDGRSLLQKQFWLSHDEVRGFALRRVPRP